MTLNRWIESDYPCYRGNANYLASVYTTEWGGRAADVMKFDMTLNLRHVHLPVPGLDEDDEGMHSVDEPKLHTMIEAVEAKAATVNRSLRYASALLVMRECKKTSHEKADGMNIHSLLERLGSYALVRSDSEIIPIRPVHSVEALHGAAEADSRGVGFARLMDSEGTAIEPVIFLPQRAPFFRPAVTHVVEARSAPTAKPVYVALTGFTQIVKPVE